MNRRTLLGRIAALAGAAAMAPSVASAEAAALDVNAYTVSQIPHMLEGRERLGYIRGFNAGLAQKVETMATDTRDVFDRAWDAIEDLNKTSSVGFELIDSPALADLAALKHAVGHEVHPGWTAGMLLKEIEAGRLHLSVTKEPQPIVIRQGLELDIVSDSVVEAAPPVEMMPRACAALGCHLNMEMRDGLLLVNHVPRLYPEWTTELEIQASYPRDQWGNALNQWSNRTHNTSWDGLHEDGG